MAAVDRARPTARDVRREERAHRILDATGELVLRWGYDKTTIDDIARAAGVAKGTIYLHWKTRDDLFVALLRRERVQLLDGVATTLERAAGPGQLRDVLTQVALGLYERPLLQASLLGDSQVLGRLVTRKGRNESNQALRDAFTAYATTLQSHGVVRADLAPVEVANVVFATIYGFFLVPPLLPDDQRVPAERLAELLTDTIVRAVAPDAAPSAADFAAIEAATTEYFEFASETARGKLRAVFPTSVTPTDESTGRERSA